MARKVVEVYIDMTPIKVLILEMSIKLMETRLEMLRHDFVNRVRKEQQSNSTRTTLFSWGQKI